MNGVCGVCGAVDGIEDGVWGVGGVAGDCEYSVSGSMTFSIYEFGLVCKIKERIFACAKIRSW